MKEENKFFGGIPIGLHVAVVVMFEIVWLPAFCSVMNLGVDGLVEAYQQSPAWTCFVIAFLLAGVIGPIGLLMRRLIERGNRK